MATSEFAQGLSSVFEAKDLDAIASYLSDDFTLTPGDPPFDKQGYLAFLAMYFTAFPDWSWNVSDIRDEGDKIVVTYQPSGTHNGDMDLSAVGIPMTVPPTGIAISAPVQETEFTVSGGLIVNQHLPPVEGGGLEDILAQLGVELPPR